MSVEFLLISLIVVATPGTGVVYTLAAGFTRGARASVVAAIGCTLGIVPHMAAAITGLAALLHTSAVAFGVLAPGSSRKTITTGIVINIRNPKLTSFFFAFLPQFVSPRDPHGLLRMLELSAVFMLITLVIFCIYGVFAAAVREQVSTRPRVLAWMRRVFAGSFVALSAKLAVARTGA